MEYMESEVAVVKTVEYERATDLMDALSPTNAHYCDRHEQPHRVQQYVFRGHEDDRYELVPSALRLNVSIKSRFGSWGKVERNPDEVTERFVEARHGTVVTQNWLNRNQVAAEVLMLIDFFQFADSSGLPLPEDSQTLRRSLEKFSIHLEELKDEEGHLKKWPPLETLSLLALAQHYGVPTRLLDWSRNGYTAAYFAAMGAINALRQRREASELPPTHLSVWAFNIERYNFRKLAPPPLGNRGQERIEIVTAPTAGNPNLHAQKGLFTLYKPDRVRPRDCVDRSSLDSAIRPFGIGPLFLRFRLPVYEASKLLRLLFLEGVSGATVYAGYKGAAEATMEQLHWDWWDRPGDVWQRFSSALE
jgi:hypothetical protein